MWSNQGWLSLSKTNCQGNYIQGTFPGTMGLIDFAGSAVVHVTGGGAALIGTLILGPRTARFTADGQVVHMPSCNPAFQALGTFMVVIPDHQKAGEDLGPSRTGLHVSGKERTSSEFLVSFPDDYS